MKRVLSLILVTAMLLCGCGKNDVIESDDSSVVNLGNIGIEVPEESSEAIESATNESTEQLPTEETESTEESESIPDEEQSASAEESTVVTTTPITWTQAYSDAYFNDPTNYRSAEAANLSKSTIDVVFNNHAVTIPLTVNYDELDALFSLDSNLYTNYTTGVMSDGLCSWNYAQDTETLTEVSMSSRNGGFNSFNLFGSCILGDEIAVTVDGLSLQSPISDVIATYGTPTNFTCTSNYPYYSIAFDWTNYENYRITASYTVIISEADNTVRSDYCNYIMIDRKKD